MVRRRTPIVDRSARPKQVSALCQNLSDRIEIIVPSMRKLLAKASDAQSLDGRV